MPILPTNLIAILALVGIAFIAVVLLLNAARLVTIVDQLTAIDTDITGTLQRQTQEIQALKNEVIQLRQLIHPKAGENAK